MLKILMLVEQMCLKAYKGYKGLLILFFLLSCLFSFVSFFCSVSRLVNGNKYPVQNCNENTNNDTNKAHKVPTC